MSALGRAVERFLGRGEATVTVPTMDGPLLPNQRLEQAEPLLTLPALDNLVAAGGALMLSSGAALHRLDPGRPAVGTPLHTLPGAVTAIAAAPGRGLAVAVEGVGIVLAPGEPGERTLATLGAGPARCITALCFLPDGALAVAVGGAGRTTQDWRRDLMEHGCSGSVWRLDVGTGAATPLAEKLAWPGGLAAGLDETLVVAEGWRHRVLRIDAMTPRTPTVAVGDLPAYPGRIVPAAGGGFWLACPAVRNQLVEFILREPGYRKRMLAEVPEPFWMAPALASGLSFKEPMQGSALKQMGILKPWSASRSYGLVVRCDAAMQPLASYHSRADGHIHGVTSLCEWGEALLVGARGAGQIVRLPGVCAPAGEAAR